MLALNRPNADRPAAAIKSEAAPRSTLSDPKYAPASRRAPKAHGAISKTAFPPNAGGPSAVKSVRPPITDAAKCRSSGAVEVSVGASTTADGGGSTGGETGGGGDDARGGVEAIGG